MNKIKGFTLTELVIFIAIMGLVIVSVLGVFAYGMNAMKKGRYNLTAINVAEKKVSEVRNLLAMYPEFNTDINTHITTYISGTSNIYPSGTIIVWHDPPSAMTDIHIYGVEKVSRTGDYAFDIYLRDYNITTFGIKRLTVKISWKDPISGSSKETRINTLISKEE